MERPDSMDIKDQNGKTRMERPEWNKKIQWIDQINGLKTRMELKPGTRLGIFTWKPQATNHLVKH